MAKNKNLKKAKGGVIAFLGFMLSPLSWWNDLFINIPLAYLFGSFFGLFSKQLALPMFILGYWITNVLGFVLMHIGIKDIVSDSNQKYTRINLAKDILISILYTVVVALFFIKGWIKFPYEYFN